MKSKNSDSQKTSKFQYALAMLVILGLILIGLVIGMAFLGYNKGMFDGLVTTWRAEPNQLAIDQKLWLPAANEIPGDLQLAEGYDLSNDAYAADWEDWGYASFEDAIAAVEKFGIESGYERVYKSADDCDASSGMVNARVVALMLEDEDRAEQYFSYMIDNSNKDEKQTNVVFVGEQSWYGWDSEMDDCSMREVSLVFQRFDIISIIEVQGVLGEITDEELLDLAVGFAQPVDENFIALYGN